MSDVKVFTVHIDGNRQFDTTNANETSHPDGYSTMGEWADALAKLNAIGGSDGQNAEFSFKVNGDVADRDAKISKLPDGAFLELIDVTVPDELVPASQPVALKEVDGGVPAGTVDEVLAWVRGSDDTATWNEGWGDRAAAALEVERADDKPRAGVVEPLEKAIDEAAAAPPVQ